MTPMPAMTSYDVILHHMMSLCIIFHHLVSLTDLLTPPHNVAIQVPVCFSWLERETVHKFAYLHIYMYCTQNTVHLYRSEGRSRVKCQLINHTAAYGSS